MLLAISVVNCKQLAQDLWQWLHNHLNLHCQQWSNQLAPPTRPKAKQKKVPVFLMKGAVTTHDDSSKGIAVQLPHRTSHCFKVILWVRHWKQGWIWWKEQYTPPHQLHEPRTCPSNEPSWGYPQIAFCYWHQWQLNQWTRCDQVEASCCSKSMCMPCL